MNLSAGFNPSHTQNCRWTDLDQGAAAPLSTPQFAAGRPCWTAAPVVTFDVRQGARLSQGAQFCEPGGNEGALRARVLVGVTAVPSGAAVVPVLAANRLRKSEGQSLTRVAAGGGKL